MANDNTNKPSVDELLKQATEYISTTQPVLDQHNQMMADLRKQAERTVGVLVDRGIVLGDKSDAFVDKVASDPGYALRMCEKMASMLQVDSVGEPADEAEVGTFKQASEADPFELAFAPDMIGRSGQQL